MDKSILNRALGLLRRAPAAAADVTPAKMPPRLIVGGNAAPELCNLCVDGGEDDLIAQGDTKRVVQVKMDGIHALYIGGRIVTREGVPLDCALHCQPGLRRMEESIGHEMMFDGEYVAEGGFNDTISDHRKGTGEGTFWIFDGMPMGAWVAGGSERPIEERLALLKRTYADAESPFVGFLNWWMMTADETRAKAAELWAMGYEGVVSKAAGTGYERARVPYWWRIKRTITLDLPIMDIIQAGGLLKAIMIRGPEGVGPIKVTRGWTKDEGQIIARADGAQSVGMLVEVSFQLTTGTKRSVRGAVFHRLRSDKRASA